jgi:type I restriction-modification system DNA methylase subunit
MVEMTAPAPRDIICDPASGTTGFLIAASEYLRHTIAGERRDRVSRRRGCERAKWMVFAQAENVGLDLRSVDVNLT